jgi:hypothetical protein
MRLPWEIVEMIIAHPIYNLNTLRSCSLTCYSWYIAAVPHLHSTLTVKTAGEDVKHRWPNPILHMHMLGLLPLVKTLIFRSWGPPVRWISSKLLNCCTLRRFRTLTNVQNLELNMVNIASFMPRIQRYFGSFLPTLRSLILTHLWGSNRQIIFFIGLFQHLENLGLASPIVEFGEGEEGDLTLIPSFTPPLRGRLMVSLSERRNLFQEMDHLFGGIRFSAMDLFGAYETRFLLRACAKTLQVLRLYPDDYHGEH